MQARALLATALALVACNPRGGPGDASTARDANVTLADGAVVPAPASASVAERYATMCASCHGDTGEGGSGTRLIDSPRTVSELTDIIDVRMPQGNPAACRGECASSLAQFIHDRFTSSALACSSVPPSPRRARLLNRREYRNTVLDLFGLRSAPAAGCDQHTFSYDPGSQTVRSVAVAGTFNGWSTTAWPLSYDSARHAWTLQHSLADGTWQYKFVLDGSNWVQDPTVPDSAPDGFGGRNSVLTQACGSATGGFDPAANLPPETRPQYFSFDTHSDSLQVGSVAASEYLRASRALVTALGSRFSSLPGCNGAADPGGCADRFLGTFGRRAFRRPLTSAESTRYRALLTGAPNFDTGLVLAVRAMLNSPSFLYRTELGERGADGNYQLTGYELASALSYFFWSTMPDDALLDAASRGDLATPAGLEAQARRLLADPRARDTVRAFATQWLDLDPVSTAPRSAALYPGFDDAARASMLEEAQRFVSYVFFDGTHRFEELFTANYTFLDARLAQHYGLPSPAGSGFTMAPHPDRASSGVLGLGAVLTRYAHSDQSSPILRGVFVRNALLCQLFPPPPANAGGVPDVNPSATTRQRFAAHTASPACSACHRYIDGLGFGFEAFDAVGRFRTMDSGRAVDSLGDLADLERFGAGTTGSYTSLAQLGTALASSPAARQCMVRQWYRFARGFRETALDACAIRSIADRFERSGHDLRELLVALVTTPDFWSRR